MASHLKVVKEVPAYRVFRTNKRFSLLLDNAGRIAAALESGPDWNTFPGAVESAIELLRALEEAKVSMADVERSSRSVA
jgi:hypothetical protein